MPLLVLVLTFSFIIILFFYSLSFKKCTEQVKRNLSLKNASIIILCLTVTSIISYFVGYKNAYDDFEQRISQRHMANKTFYAEIKEIDGKSIVVDGLEVNSSAYQGTFNLSVYGETELEWNDTPVSFDDLKKVK